MIELPEDYLKILFLEKDGHLSEIGAEYFSELIYDIISQS